MRSSQHKGLVSGWGSEGVPRWVNRSSIRFGCARTALRTMADIGLATQRLSAPLANLQTIVSSRLTIPGQERVGFPACPMLDMYGSLP
jgi:hypothetical protein